MDLKDIQKPVNHLLEETNNHLINALNSDIGLIKEIIKSTPASKGKKIRSTLLFLLAGLSDYQNPVLPQLAASVELLHLASLIHDDVVDNSEFRRGEKTLNSHFGNFLSVLWGDFLFINSLKSFNSADNAYTGIMLNAAKSMIEGQILEVENTTNFKIKLNTYYNIIQKKTSSLFAAVAQIAAPINKSSHVSPMDFFQFGLDFGTIFQISDDMLDIFSNNSGKDRFRDLKEGKITLPVILLLKENHKDAIKNFSEEKADRLIELFQEHQIEKSAMDVIETFHKKGQTFLDNFNDCIYKEALVNLLTFIKYRDY